MVSQNAPLRDRHWRISATERRPQRTRPLYSQSAVPLCHVSSNALTCLSSSHGFCYLYTPGLPYSQVCNPVSTQKYLASLRQRQLSSSYLIFYSSKEGAIFSEYRVLIPPSISSHMVVTSLLGMSSASLVRQSSSRFFAE